MTCLVCGNPIVAIFYTSGNSAGNFDIYCTTCYAKNILDNYPGMNSSGTNVVKSVCECGKEKHGFASHSSWCQVKDNV